MRLPVSTSSGDTGSPEVARGVVGDAVVPAAPEDPQPCAGEDPDSMRMVGAAVARAPVDVPAVAAAVGRPAALPAAVRS